MVLAQYKGDACLGHRILASVTIWGCENAGGEDYYWPCLIWEVTDDDIPGRKEHAQSVEKDWQNHWEQNNKWPTYEAFPQLE